MIQAFLWGLLAASSLLFGALISIQWQLSKKVMGSIMAFGVGVLISAIAFDLTLEAYEMVGSVLVLASGLASGALTFFIGDKIIDNLGGNHRKKSEGSEGGSAKAIALGTVLDGIPESIVLGLGILVGGSVSLAVLCAIFLSNLPEAIGATSGMLKTGWGKRKLLFMWVSVVLISGFSSFLGYTVFSYASPAVTAFTMTFAAGALLTMLADTMMPEAYQDTHEWAGLLTTLGFCLAFLISLAG